MTERPILFSAPMVRAIRDDSKKQTRRMVKPQPPRVMPPPQRHEFSIGGHDYRCPYGQPGDMLWVRETWQAWQRTSAEYDEWKPLGVVEASASKQADYNRTARVDAIEYAADAKSAGPWTPSIHMPRWASRITLENVSVRVERLRDISEEDAYAEGVLACDGLIDEVDIARASKLCGVAIDDARALFFALFATIYGWELLSLNPWVWVVEFRRLP